MTKTNIDTWEEMRQIKSTRIRSALPLAMSIILLQQPGAAFIPSSLKNTRHSLSRLDYRHVEDRYITSVSEEETAVSAAVAFVASGIHQNQPLNSVPPPTSLSRNMPPWLSHRRGHLAEEKLHELNEVMTKSYLSEKEVETVLSAVKDASRDDPEKLAGAAEFCLILVETMEMDVHTLVAAAFHFCTCVTAWERSSLLARFSMQPSHPPNCSFWDSHHHHYTHGIETYGEDAISIARDAAKLKRTETLATSQRATTDMKDAENLFSLLLSKMGDWRALAIRSAACLYRLRGILAARETNKSNTPFRLTPDEVRVSREALRIYAPLASRLGMHRLKNEIEGAAFRIIYPRQYKTVTNMILKHRRKDRRSGIIAQSEEDSTPLNEGLKHVLAEITEKVRQVLQQDPTFMENAGSINVSARVKEPFSLWKKMLRVRAKNVLDVPDALALRVVLDGAKQCHEEDEDVTRARERALCYYVQKLCTERWRPSSGNLRYKDYIERPKPNGYQSLHFMESTSWRGQDWPFEVQVRTGEMHRVAEYGLAAHWDYKLKGTKGKIVSETVDAKKVVRTSDKYNKYVQEWYPKKLGNGLKGKLSVKLSSSQMRPIKLNEEKKQIRAERIRAHAERLAPYIEALSTAKSILVKEHVFIFLSPSSVGSQYVDGKILSLPAGSCVVDALREGEKSLGINLDWRKGHLGIVHNGNVTDMKQRLSNGDVLTVPVFEAGAIKTMSTH